MSLLILFHYMLERDESCLMGSGYTRTPVPDRLISNSEFSQIHADHFRLHFNTTEHLSIVDTYDRTDHFRNDNHITEVSLDTAGLFTRIGLFLRLTEALDESHGFTLKTTGHTPTCAGSNEVHELIICEVEKGIELDSPEGKFFEGTLFAQFGNFFGVHVD